MPNGAELFVQAAARMGLDPIFTLVGDHLNEVLAAAARAGMRVVDMRHESGVTHAADAWARIHRRPALSLVTGGPGHTNSMTGDRDGATGGESADRSERKPGARTRRPAGLPGYRPGGHGAAGGEVGGGSAFGAGDSVLPEPRLFGGEFGTAGRGAPDHSGGRVYGKCDGGGAACRWDGPQLRPAPT